MCAADRLGRVLRSFAVAFVVASCAALGRAQSPTFGPWYAVGPFEHPDADKSLEPPHAPEKALKQLAAGENGPDLAADVREKSAPVLKWTIVPAREGASSALDVGAIEFARVLAQPAGTSASWVDRQCAYLYRRVDCDADMEIPIAVGADDGLRFWLNGDVVAEFPLPRGLLVSDHQLVLRLKRGANHLLAKVTNLGGAWSFRMSAWRKIDQKLVDQAIDRGLKYLRETQLLDGSWGVQEHWGAGAPAFALYTLLKCGVPADDPVARMARAAVDARAIEHTYTAACVILALTSMHDERELPAIREALANLRSWQTGEGLLGYPVYADGSRPPVDLSNTLYAALAYRAAEQAGIDVPDKDWIDIAQGALRCLCREVPAGPATGKSAPKMAGFSYRTSTNEATGSMTTAGLSVLALAQEGLQGKLPGPLALRVKSAVTLGMTWLENRVQWVQNPGQNAHHYFWVYGVERAGTLLGFDTLAGVDWYWSGAAYLIGKQKENGSWSDYGETEEPIDTLLALLFLRRATVPVVGETLVGRASPRKAPSTGPQGDRAASGAREAGGADDDLSIHARGNDPTIVWVSSLKESLRADLSGPKGLDVTALELWGHAADSKDAADALLAKIDGALVLPDELSKLEIVHTFAHSGAWIVRVKVRVKTNTLERVIESPSLALSVNAAFDQRRLENARSRAENLIVASRVTGEASSNATRAREAADGNYLSAWRCNAKDRAPSIKLTFERPIQASRLSIAHAGPRLLDAAKPRANEVEVVVNGGTKLKLALDADVLLKGELDLPPRTPVRTLELKILSAHDGKLGDAELGFSEIELSGR